MTWERHFFGPRIPDFDPPITWVDWAQLGASYVGWVLVLVFAVWLLRESMRDDELRRLRAETEERYRSLEGMFSVLRFLLSIGRV